MALVLTRGNGEGVDIGDDIRIIVRILGGRARLEISAPDDIAIVRSELRKTTNEREQHPQKNSAKAVDSSRA
jgi:carbon storage regulator CsrA